MSTQMHAMGVSAFRDTLKTGGCVSSLLNDLFRDLTPHTEDIFSGAVSDLLASYVALRSAGFVSHSADSDLDTFLHSPGSIMAAQLTQKLSKADDSQWVNSRLHALVNVVSTHREKITWPVPVATALPTPEPLAVRVVSMPDRETVMTVKRDDDTLEIESTTSYQRDAAEQKE